MSERLGRVTDEERRIESLASLQQRPLWTESDIAESRDADVFLIGAVEPFNAGAISSLAGCRAIVRRGVGVDNVDVDAATTHAILVANVPDASVEEVSDHALALSIGLLRQVAPLDRAVRAGEWMDPQRIEIRRRSISRLHDATLGVIGLGRIGRALAMKALPLFGQVIGHDPFAQPDLLAGIGIGIVALPELLAASDVISLHVPLTADTHHLINDSTLAMTKHGVFIVNTARGPIIDTRSLVAALNSGVVAGAALDVVEGEPLDGNDELAAFDSVVLTAHSAASSKRASQELRRRAVDAVVAVLEHRWPDSTVNRTELPANATTQLWRQRDD